MKPTSITDHRWEGISRGFFLPITLPSGKFGKSLPLKKCLSTSLATKTGSDPDAEFLQH